jgi:high-affinity Fe2+/Pb2+ permease
LTGLDTRLRPYSTTDSVNPMRNVWTIVGVIAAVIIAWFVVDFALHAIFLIFRLALVAIVAIVVYLALRFLLRGRSD